MTTKLTGNIIATLILVSFIVKMLVTVGYCEETNESFRNDLETNDLEHEQFHILVFKTIKN